MTETMESIRKMAQDSTEKGFFSKLFSVKDLKSNNFGSLLIANNVEEAIRAVKIRLLYDHGSLVQQFPADYMLYDIGYFNTTTGVLESTGVPVPIMSVFDISESLKKGGIFQPVDVPEFMKGDKKDDCGCEESSSTDLAENS